MLKRLKQWIRAIREHDSLKNKISRLNLIMMQRDSQIKGLKTEIKLIREARQHGDGPLAKALAVYNRDVNDRVLAQTSLKGSKPGTFLREFVDERERLLGEIRRLQAENGRLKRDAQLRG